MQIEIDAAEGTVVIGLAEDDGHLFVERDAVAQMRAAADIGANGFVYEREQRGLAFFGRLIDADNMPVVGLEGLLELGCKCFDS